MRHLHRFSGPRGAQGPFHGRSHGRFHDHFGQPSLHALWHAIAARHADRTGHADRAEQRFDTPAAPREPGEHARHGAPDPRNAPGRRHRHNDHRHFALHALWHAMGRHHDPRSGGPGGRGGRFGGGPGGPGGFGGEGDGFPRGRKFSSDDLQLMLLSLLDAQPSHGYELIKALETRSNGFYTPSPGMVYPALTYLEELGYVSVQLEGNRKRYALSDAGREYLNANRERVDLMFARLTHIARKMDSVRRAFAGEEPADVSEGGWVPELTEARRMLKTELLRRDSAPADEQRRIAAILMRAAREIVGGGGAKPDANGNGNARENPDNGDETSA
ncbi:PadR family transcriptional regulator [Paraburkholderia sp. MMS20-SJTR3]|uniref:PadR family transcriptional regulator n=1 Tax=Paraburkholderia sejongensis TaxID=2886946 RepID=A0ABS8JZR0_9BURK|nr:PadR family transcriptional regulator [Paraburkholderia sp. MMS20-SJTR3]MCC8395406.1 PadR family transcriptional regulator [Paraburkholderia sp. MMS20-SJTR3]